MHRSFKCDTNMQTLPAQDNTKDTSKSVSAVNGVSVPETTPVKIGGSDTTSVGSQQQPASNNDIGNASDLSAEPTGKDKNDNSQNNRLSESGESTKEMAKSPIPLPPPPPPPATTSKKDDKDDEGSESNDSDGKSDKSKPASSVEEILVNKDVITTEQLNQLRAESLNTGAQVMKLLVDREMVTQDQLARAKADYYNIDFIDLTEIGVAPEALSSVSESISQRYKMMPFALDKEKNLLSVAMANPLDLRAIDFVEKKTGHRVKPFLAAEEDLTFAISERYSQSLSSEVTEALRDSGHEEKKVVDVRKLGEVIREAPIAKIVETILTFAVKARASDVHIEAQETKTRVRYRIDGILHEKLVLPKGVHEAVVSRIKILADLKIDEKRLPQDGRFSFSVGEDVVDLRVSTLPTVNGEKVVMRLLQKAQKVPTLPDLGLRGMALKNLQVSILVPHGIILITGPTGSGKTTTLYSILSKINTPKVNIITLEDPVEYEIPGVNQVQVNPKAGLTFASGMRSFLRQDPNIIQVGEIRDQETAELAIQASLTGHLVFSTLHTNSAAGALPRLLDMQAEPFLLASSITCIVGQRVVRKICEYCKADFKPEPVVVEDLKKVLGEKLFAGWLQQQKLTEQNITLSRGGGCAECNNTGYITTKIY